jgi:hypothetical protein
MHERGALQVEIAAKEDKRQITALLGCSAKGELLPLQLIYQGKTEKCHPRTTFPEGFGITHSENHWSTIATMKDYVIHVLSPYCASVRQRLGLQQDHKALCVLDVFRAHRVQDVMEIFSEHNILLTFVPASCTGELQPLDLSGNGTFKQALKSRFIKWYADQVPDEEGGECEVDLRLSTLKPLHAGWVIEAWNEVRANPDCLITGWEKAGITEALRAAPIDILVGSLPSNTL